MKLVLVPTDMSDTAAHALRYAGALAERFDAHLLVLYADPFMPPMDFGATIAFSVRRDELIESAREELEMHVEENIDATVPYDVRVLAQSPVDAILEQACDTGADLIVMGTHGRSGLTRLIVGSVTEAVIRLASVPVIAVNSFCCEQPAGGPVVAPVAFTPASLEALRYAATLAENSPLLLYRGSGGGDAVSELSTLQEWIPRELRGRAEMKVVPQAATAENIAAYAKQSGAGLIALGVPAAPHLIGGLLHSSPCPVLTINERTVRLTVPDRTRSLTPVAAAE